MTVPGWVPGPRAEKEHADERAELQVYAVVRIGADAPLPQGPSGPGIGAEQLRGVVLHDVTVTSVLPTLEEAEQEVQRLNALNGEKGVRYFWMATRWYPHGRDEKVAS